MGSGFLVYISGATLGNNEESEGFMGFWAPWSLWG